MPADKMDLIRPAIEGTERALNAGLKAGVERIVLTSSMAAIAYGHDRNRAAPFTAADWTDLEGRGCQRLRRVRRPAPSGAPGRS